MKRNEGKCVHFVIKIAKIFASSVTNAPNIHARTQRTHNWNVSIEMNRCVICVTIFCHVNSNDKLKFNHFFFWISRFSCSHRFFYRFTSTSSVSGRSKFTLREKPSKTLDNNVNLVVWTSTHTQTQARVRSKFLWQPDFMRLRTTTFV